MDQDEQLDVVIIGAGAAGVIALVYAMQAGLRAVVLEREAEVGGLWAKLPAWQDIQNRPEDWTLGDIPLSDVRQPAIADNIRAWAAKFGLGEHIRLRTPVLAAAPSEGGWTIETPRGALSCRWLIAATGAHNAPRIPSIVRQDSKIAEFHSSSLRDPSILRGRKVAVVGGGASAFDLIDLALQNEASEIAWIYRSLKWMVPTLKAKRFASNIREVSKSQLAGVPIAQMNQAIDADLRVRYAKFNVEALLPDTPFDFSRDQLIPGRGGLVGALERIERHRDEIGEIAGRTIKLRSGGSIDADIVLWGTGYDMDLSYLGACGLGETTRPTDLARRCGAMVKSLDTPNLYFMSVGLESTSATPWHYAHLARTLVSDMLGSAQLGREPVLEHLNYIGTPMYLARFDPTHYPAGTWRDEYRALLSDHPNDRPMPIPEFRGKRDAS